MKSFLFVLFGLSAAFAQATGGGDIGSANPSTWNFTLKSKYTEGFGQITINSTNVAGILKVTYDDNDCNFVDDLGQASGCTKKGVEEYEVELMRMPAQGYALYSLGKSGHSLIEEGNQLYLRAFGRTNRGSLKIPLTQSISFGGGDIGSANPPAWKFRLVSKSDSKIGEFVIRSTDIPGVLLVVRDRNACSISTGNGPRICTEIEVEEENAKLSEVVAGNSKIQSLGDTGYFLVREADQLYVTDSAVTGQETLKLLLLQSIYF